jgi:hypothetical protein
MMKERNMKKAVLFSLILAQIVIHNQCSRVEVKKEQKVISKSKNISSLKSDPTPSENEASILPSFSTPIVAKETENKVQAEAVKKIPFRKLFVRNITFTENKGQLERFGKFHSQELDQVKFYTKAFNGTAYFANNGIGFGFQRGGLNYIDNVINNSENIKLSKTERREVSGFFIEFLNCNKNPEITGINQQATKINYLIGDNPDAFITDISSYEQLRYKGLYRGIDLLYYTKDENLKYDYIVSPDANVSDIRMKYKGVKNLKINENGELEVQIEWGILYDKKPYSYQEINGEKREVEVAYKKINHQTIGFEVKGKYDKAHALIIDPFTVQWSTYIGTSGPGVDNGYIEATTVDNNGAVLGTGWSNSSFPINSSVNGYDKTHNGAEDAFVFKLQGNGTTMDFVTYLGGTGFEVGTGIGVNTSGEVCIAGYTQSYTSLTFKENSTTTLTIGTGDKDVNVVGIGSYGFGSTIRLVNGANYMQGTITSFSNATTIRVTVTTTSGAGTFGTWQVNEVSQVGFPTTGGAIQPNNATSNGLADIFYVKLSSTGNALNYGTHYGGSDTDWALDLVLDNSNNAYITGRTQSSGLATAGAYRTSYGGGYDSYVLKINAANTLGYFTYIGGAGNDIGKGIAVNASGEAYLTGMTSSSGQATAGAFQTAIAGADEAFVARVNSAGSALVYFTYLGGTGADIGGAIKLISNDAVVVGTTAGGFPLQNAFDATAVAGEAFLTRLNATGTALTYSTYIGGNGADNTKGNDYGQYHKNGGIEIVNNQPVVVISTASSSGIPIVNPFNFTAVQNDGVSTYTYDGSTFKGGGIGDMYVIVLDEIAQTVLYASYYGGAENDYPTAGVNADKSNNNGCIVIAGGVHSIPFPTTVGAFQTRRFNTINEDQHALVKICLPEILPVELLNFRGFWNGDLVRLTWTTACEKNSDYFIVERSTDGVNFYAIGKVKAAGNCSEELSYLFHDTDPASGNNLYRLKQYDQDGTFHYSHVINVRTGENLRFIVSPNPGDGLFIAEGNLSENGEVSVNVFNETGQLIYSTKDNRSKGSCRLEIDLRNFADGAYILKIAAGEFNQVEKVRKY